MVDDQAHVEESPADPPTASPVADDEAPAVTPGRSATAGAAETAGSRELGDAGRRESFVLTLTLDDADSVRRFTVRDVRTEAEACGAGWHPERITAFVADRAGLLVPCAAPEGPASPGNGPPPAVQARVRTTTLDAGIVALGATRSLEATVRFGDGPPAPDSQVRYCATLRARELGTAESRTVAETYGQADVGLETVLRFEDADLRTGVQRLELTMRCSAPGPAGIPHLLRITAR